MSKKTHFDSELMENASYQNGQAILYSLTPVSQLVITFNNLKTRTPPGGALNVRKKTYFVKVLSRNLNTDVNEGQYKK